MMRSVPMQDDNSGFPSEPLPDDVPPAPDAAFHWIREDWGYHLRCAPLEGVAKHLFTSRQLGFPGEPASGADRWEPLARAMGVPPGSLMRITQVHGGHVRVVRRGEVSGTSATERPEADAVVSNAPGLGLLVQVADCVPILIADPEAGAAAAVHAGWRGTCAGIAAAAVEALVREFGCRPERMVAALGPSVGPADYEVGEALLVSFAQAGHGASIDRWFRRSGPEQRLFLDLWRANEDQLRGAGVPGEAVHRSGLSTPRHPRWLESYRRDGDRAGRMAALVVVPGPRR